LWGSFLSICMWHVQNCLKVYIKSYCTYDIQIFNCPGNFMLLSLFQCYAYLAWISKYAFLISSKLSSVQNTGWCKNVYLGMSYKFYLKYALMWYLTFNAGIKSLRATLPDEYLLGILLLEPYISLIYAWKTNKCTNY
jgi:hypothetical protein